MSLARTYVKAGDPAGARANVAAARATRRDLRSSLEGAALIALAERPRLLAPVMSAWYALRGVPRTANGAGAR
jgi:hypothetical protein